MFLAEDEPTVEPGKDDDDDDPINPLVDALFDEVENLRLQVSVIMSVPQFTFLIYRQLFESEMRCALIEAETREEVMREMEERMRIMEAMYSRRLMNEVFLRKSTQNAEADCD